MGQCCSVASSALPAQPLAKTKAKTKTKSIQPNEPNVTQKQPIALPSTTATVPPLLTGLPAQQLATAVFANPSQQPPQKQPTRLSMNDLLTEQRAIAKEQARVEMLINMQRIQEWVPLALEHIRTSFLASIADSAQSSYTLSYNVLVPEFVWTEPSTYENAFDKCNKALCDAIYADQELVAIQGKRKNKYSVWRTHLLIFPEKPTITVAINL